jgi:DNA polymerase-1
MIHGFENIIAINFEFSAQDGERPCIVCLSAQNLITGKKWQVIRDELLLMLEPPYPHDSHTLVVSYYASKQMNCYLSLGWTLPNYILDLFVEFRCLTNGLKLTSGGDSLFGALSYFGLSGIHALEKKKHARISHARR